MTEVKPPYLQEIILHIGMHKTGSTAIQSALVGYDRDGARYADLGRANHSVPLMFAFDRETTCETSSWIKHFGFTRDLCSRLASNAHVALDRELSLDRRMLIFSGEALSVWSEQAVLALAHRLHGCAEIIRVIAYVRDPVDYANAIVQQRVKTRAPLLPLPSRYQQSLGAYMTAFGHDQVHLRRYDRSHFLHGSVVADFAGQIRIAGVEHNIQSNEAASFDAIRLLHLLARHIPIPVGHPRLVQGWQRLCDWIQTALPGPTLRLPDDLARSLVTRDDIAWLDQTFAIRFDSEGHPDMPTPDEALDAAIRSFLLDGVEDLRDRLAGAMRRCAIPFDHGDSALNLMSRAYTYFVFDAEPTDGRK